MRTLTWIPFSVPIVLLKSSPNPVMIGAPTGSLAGDQNSSSTACAAGAAALPADVSAPIAGSAAAPTAARCRNVRRSIRVDAIVSVLHDVRSLRQVAHLPHT